MDVWIGVFLDIDLSINFNAPPLFALAGMAIILYTFIYFLVKRQPRGPQPATYGHLQTLVDLTDDRGTGHEGTLWWGDRGVGAHGFRKAGTAVKPKLLGPILMDEVYS